MKFEVDVTLGEGMRVDARTRSFVIPTDQPSTGDSAPTPVEVFLAAIGTCAGVFARAFLDARKLPASGVRIHVEAEKDTASGLLRTIRTRVTVPPTFPSKYEKAVLKAVEGCLVKQSIEAGLVFETALDRA